MSFSKRIDPVDLSGSSKANSIEESNISFPVTTTSSQDDILSLEKRSGTSRLIKILVFGLVLYLLDISLHISIGSHYLDMRNCHRGLKQSFEHFSLGNLVQFDNQSSTSEEFISEAELTAFNNDDPVQAFLNKQLYFKVRKRFISLIPDHWEKRIKKIVDFQITKYKPSQIAELCTVNGKSFQNAIEIGTYVCRDALTETQRKTIETTFEGISKEEEDRLIVAVIEQNYSELLKIFPSIVGEDVPGEAFQVVQRIMNNLSKRELSKLIAVLQDPAVIKNLEPLMTAMGKIQQKNIDILKEAFSQVNIDNLPKIDRLLVQLNVTFTDFITNPGILASVIQDREKTAILLEVRDLLPNFGPEVLNALLEIQDNFESTPGAGVVVQKLFELPLGVMLKLVGDQPSPEEMAAVKKLGAALQSEKIKTLFKVVQELKLLPEETRLQRLRQLANECKHDVLELQCEDASVDLCPNGHLLYGLLTMGALILPGIIYATSEFVHFREFRFGSIWNQPFGKTWSKFVKFAFLPIYIVAMIPLTVVITVVQYYRVLKKIFQQKSPGRIQEIYTEALNLHGIEAAGNSFFQIIIQIHFLTLLVSFGAGTFIAGVDANTFFNNVVPLTVVSLLVSLVNFSLTSWKLTNLDHRMKSLQWPETTKIWSVVSYFLWFFTSLAGHIVSLVLMAMVFWIENLSIQLFDGNDKIQEMIVPIIILTLSFPFNMYIHMKLIGDKNRFELAQGFLSAVFPVKHLHQKVKSHTRHFFLINQAGYWSLHIAAWFSYSMILYSIHNEEAGILRFTPLILALVSFGPFFGAIHWVQGVNPSYKPRNKHKDLSMMDDEDPFRSIQKKYLFYTWQIVTVITRLTSLALLCFVFFEHWFEVGGAFKVALLMMIPYLLLIIVINIGLHLAFFGTARLQTALMSIFLPTDFLDDCSISKASRYVVLNMGLNLGLHLILWLTMTFYCWECTKVLDLYFRKLSICFPIAVSFWLVNLVLTLVTWKLSIRASVEDHPGSKKKTFEPYQGDKKMSAINSLENSVTTKF